jgi:hypothetical protein
MALMVTGAGGLCLLAGVMLLGHVVGSYDLDAVLAAGDQIRAHSLYPILLTLILIGALSKKRTIPVPFLAAPRDGGSHAGVGVSALSNHGQGRCVSAGKAMACVVRQ